MRIILLIVLMIGCSTNPVVVKESNIPGAGNGVFAIKDIPANTTIGEYSGKLITNDEYRVLYNNNQWHYVMEVEQCSYPYTGWIKYIDGREGNFTTRINYSPPKFRNVKFLKICPPPYALVVSTRDIKKGEELYIDYGDNYVYDFMENEKVIQFFKELEKSK
jgi:SET domain-containing protein